MMTAIIIFIVVATIFALASLAFVAWDIISDRRKQEEPAEEPVEEAPEMPPLVVVPVVAPDPEPEPEVMPEIVDHIDAEEADAMISDDLAMKSVRYESPAGRGEQGIINIGVIDAMFEAGAVVTLEDLKQKDLLTKKTGRLKVLAAGMLNKPLTIKAENYSVQAIKMIELTGGTVIILKDMEDSAPGGEESV